MKKTPLKVLHLIHHLRIGGAERMLVTLTQAFLANDKISPSIAVFNSGGDLEQKVREIGIPLYNLHKDRESLPFFLFKLRKIIKSNGIDILHMHAFSAAMWGRLCSIGTDVKYRVFTDHDITGWINPKKHLIVNRILFPLTNRIVSVSVAARQALIEREKVDGRYVDVIPNGINLNLFVNTPPIEHCRSIYSLKGTCPFVGMVARNSHEKGIDIFIEAIALLKKSGVKMTGVIAGDGPLHEDLKNLTRTLDVEDSVRFLGAIAPDKIPEVLKCFDIGICPSRQESFGLAAIETMATGKAMIVSDTGGLPEIICHGETGLIVKREDSGELAKNIKLLIENENYRNKLATKGKKFVLQTFSSEMMAKRYTDLYDKVINEASV